MAEEFLRTDSEIQRNAALELFTTNNGTRYMARALPLDLADEWMDRANAVEPLQAAMTEVQKAASNGEEGAVEKLKAARKAYREAVYECVFSYDPDQLPKDKIISEGVTPAQMARAFAMLQQVNDPFVCSTIIQSRMAKEIVKGLPIGNGGIRTLSR